MCKKIYVFGYGSLINKTNIAKTTRQKVELISTKPVWLKGYTRLWNTGIEIISKSDSLKRVAIFLNIEKSPDEQINGVIFSVNKIQFENLKKRELSYNCINISDKIYSYKSEKKIESKLVYTFISKEKHIVKNDDPSHVVLRRYLKVIEDGCRKLGADFFSDYLKTTKDNEYKILEDDYSFYDNIQEQHHI